MIAAAGCGGGGGDGGGGAPVNRVSGPVELVGAAFLTSRSVILDFPQVADALSEVGFLVWRGSRPPAIEGTYSLSYRFERHTLDNSLIGRTGTLELAFSNQQAGTVDFRIGPAGAMTVLHGFLNGDNFDFTVVGVVENSASLIGLPCRERDVVVITGRTDTEGDLKARILVMPVRIEEDCIDAYYAAGFDPEQTVGEHVIIDGDATRLGP
ncbi:MAG: hypothetical protein ACYTGN_02860 [Planctomycetota bacterium]|jgi:hypothetical protein